MASKQSSKHLGNEGRATMASGEKKHHGSTLMDGIVGGLPRRVSPPIVDGIVRGVGRNVNPPLVGAHTKVDASSTKQSKGAFGSGAFPEGKM